MSVKWSSLKRQLYPDVHCLDPRSHWSTITVMWLADCWSWRNPLSPQLWLNRSLRVNQLRSETRRGILLQRQTYVWVSGRIFELRCPPVIGWGGRFCLPIVFCFWTLFVNLCSPKAPDVRRVSNRNVRKSELFLKSSPDHVDIKPLIFLCITL